LFGLSFDTLKLSLSSKVLLLFTASAVVLRFFSFFPAVIDHDESTYIVIADALLQGYTYQVDYIDTKPIGIFWMLAAIQYVFGSSIFIMRLFAAFAIALTCWFLYLSKLKIGGSHQSGIAAGIIYIFFSSIYTRYGVSPNTETYFNLFIALALYLYLQRGGMFKYFLAGLSLGIGFIFKYVVLFDGLAFGLFLLWEAYRGKIEWKKAWSRSLIMAFSAALPFIGVYLYYVSLGQVESFWFHTFTVSGRYPSTEGILHYFAFPLEFALRFLPIFIFAAFALKDRKVMTEQGQFILLWFTLVLVVILLPGNPFGHYFVQLMLPISFLAGEFFAIPVDTLPKWIKWLRKPRIGYSLLILLVITQIGLQKKDYYDRKDPPKLVAQYLNENLEEGDQIYTTEDHIIYHLCNRLPLIRYVHPSLFWREKHIKAMEIPLEEELAKIIDAKPRYLIFRDPPESKRFKSYREQYYTKVFQVDGRTQVYERLEE
jgi:4-amino-4-deoxy-L-arabinose transferase-like glycosyltransferase